MNGKQFAELCQTCYGAYWASDTAAALGLTYDQVEQNAAADRVPIGIAAALLAVAQQKRDRLSQLIDGQSIAQMMLGME